MPPKELKYETYRKSTDLIKSRFVKLEQSVNAITASQTPLSPVQIRQLNTIFAELKKKRADFEANFNRILECDHDEATEDILSSDVDAINDLYVRIASVIEVAIASDPTPQSSFSEDVTDAPFSSTASLSVKLPKLNLQTFDGSPLQWVSFINLFDTTVHKNVNISSVSKFQYLLSVLSGEPLNLIKSLNLTAPNYLIAYNLLRERYHNTRRLSTLHLNHILDLPTLSNNNPKQMRAFVTTFYEHTEALKALDCDITEDNPLLAAHLLRKLDSKTIQNLEQYRITQAETEPHSLPKVSEIIKFMNMECSKIEDANLHSNPSESKRFSSFSPSTSKYKNDYHKKSHFAPKDVAMHSVSSNPSQPTANKEQNCFVCSKVGHKVYGCPVFKNKSPNDRYQVVKENKRCVSCLGTHHIRDCNSKSTCKTCNKKHHTLLHFEQPRDSRVAPQAPVPSVQPDAVLSCTSHHNARENYTTVLLGTALVKLTAANGNSYVFRALLDSGSMSDFISERAAQLLGTRRMPSNITVVGLSNVPAHTKGFMNLKLQSLSGHVVASQHTFHVLEKISVDLPRAELSQKVMDKVKPFILADPTFNKPGPIDVLLGGALYPQLLCNENYSLGLNMPYALGTIFGYIIVGQAPCNPSALQPSNIAISLLSTTDMELHSSLQRFWTQEELPPCSNKTAEEIRCDEFFNLTHSRDSQGRYVVRLPFRNDVNQIGTSKPTAEQRFHSLERKLQNRNNSEFRDLYVDFMHEYHALGHMEKVSSFDETAPHYFLPHHGVLKSQSSTTKLRVVFDASAKTSSGLSLNDVLLTGPKLQNDICDVLLHFRQKNIVFSCDIRQMYRQIRIHPDDQNFQLILWRDNPTLPLSVFQLTTVTYGMSCSPYLAIKTLQQLAEDEGVSYPRAAEILKLHSYVDDLIAGADNENEAEELQQQLIQLLRLGGFELRKWVSNSPKLLQNLPETHQESPVFLQQSADPHFSILGMHWSPSTDCFKYNINLSCETPTKRKVLSLIAQIYDPCGFLAPLTMQAKCFMQLLWTMGLSWDDPLPADLAEKWHTFLTNVQHLSQLSIPRSFQFSLSNAIELHGFADASESGYAAVVYFRCQMSTGEVVIRLVMAKTRVAPLKRVTLPRLELCAAHLLAQLVAHCRSLFPERITAQNIHLWSDSSVVLTWLRTPPYRLKTYVANRVAQTQELVPLESWRHIASADNPADCASRGISASLLVDHTLWWTGPPWLKLNHSDWPTSRFVPIDLSSSEEIKKTPLVVLASTPHSEWDILSAYSSWDKLLRIVALILRFIHNCRSANRFKGHLSPSEITKARLKIFSLVQQAAFADEISSLQKQRDCSTRLQRLKPFLDSDGILRVGGRLNRSSLPSDVRHPVLLPKKHHVVDLIVDHCHKTHLHSGPQLTQALLSQSVWILCARSVIRSRIFKCVTCFKNKPRNTTPLMGDLPPSRITPARPFLSTGIDYCGPFTIKALNLRSVKHVKVYLCIFVCMVTKAVHVEVVTDLTTDGFLAALTRFVSRRGLCSNIYSDCGTNFVGADATLRRLIHSHVNSPPAQDSIQKFAVQKGINFHFNPPAAPHQGGLWESAVKSAKHHLRRVMGDTVLTLSQFITLSTQVEAILNSRPLTPLSNDPADLEALTPGHFLIGAPLASVPEPDLLDTPDNRLQHWQLVQAFHQRIWKRWQLEYLHTLQQRYKWTQPRENLKIGDLVLVHQNSPPLTWPLARVTAVHPGPDGVVRVVDLHTPNGHLTRPVVKVFPLPTE